ncbi:DUF1778 domain-containing protein [Nostoc ellipsosporum NOK]|nr:DUF1778 domain-containing protein [Nostoc ellipsosporum NOK]BAZ50065.1 hypothetical protein NIES4103_26790 [Nostoc sp. NIES-4103]
MVTQSKLDNSNRDHVINIRVHQHQRDLIDRAAAILGKNRSDFILDVICREAKTVITDNTFFALDDDKYQQFIEALDSPPQANENLHKLLTTKSPWE